LGDAIPNRNTLSREPERRDTAQVQHVVVQVRSKHVTSRDRVLEASTRVADLERRLGFRREKSARLTARLNALQEAAVEAAVRGEEPPSFTEIEAELREAQTSEHILEQALKRAKALLATAEVESRRAAQAEQDEKFADTLKELMGHAAKMAECHARLTEIHAASGGRYSPSLLWSALASDKDYAQWLCNAQAFLNRLRQGKDAPPAVIADCDRSLAAALTSNAQGERADRAANDHQAQETSTARKAGRAGGYPRA
jgi:hypothetical protein